MHQGPRIRTFRISGHQPVVDILVVATVDTFRPLLAADARPEVLEAHGYLVSVEQDHVRDGGRVDAEEGTVQDGVRRAQVRRRIVHVLVVVVHAPVVEGPGHVVVLAEVVVHPVADDGQVARVPRVGEVHGQDDEAPYEHAQDLVEG